MADIDENPAATLDDELAPLSLAERLRLIAGRFSAPVFTTSLGPEDQVITHMIAETGATVRLVTLQTGRLFSETLALLDETRERYALSIEEFHPERADIDAYVAEYGLNGFYDRVEARHACCHIRKIKPLGKALSGADAWLTGLRRSQSENRESVPFAEWSAERNLLKINPLADWTADDVASAVKRHEIPVNALHARGYASIGCDPCTRAIKPGEPERAGRWWWERDDSRECGLHVAVAGPDSLSGAARGGAVHDHG